LPALRFSLELLALSVASALLTVSLASALFPPTEEFHLSNPYWNGLEEFSRIAGAKALEATVDGVVPEKSVIFIVGPSINCSQTYVEALKTFVFDGGTLVLMDESGVANVLLSSFGLDVYVDGHAMLDAVFYHRSWKMPKIINVVNSSLTADVEEIALNIPSILRINDSSVKVLASSSSFSFLDLNGDFEHEDGEPFGPFPVLAEAAYGRGRIIVFSDSSLFLNSFIGLGGNRKLLENLVSGKAAFIDVSVWSTSLPLSYRKAVLRVYNVFSAPEFKSGLALLTVTVIYTLIYRRKPSQGIDEVEELLKRHPDWDKRLLEALREAREKVG